MVPMRDGYQSELRVCKPMENLARGGLLIVMQFGGGERLRPKLCNTNLIEQLFS